MPDFTAEVQPSFIVLSIAVILAITAIGIAFVKIGKKTKNKL